MENTLNIKYNGDSVNGQFEINSLTSVLLNLADLIKAIQKELVNNDKEIKILVKTFEKGSFSIDITLLQNFFEQAMTNIFGSENNRKIVNETLTILLGGSAVLGGAKTELFGLIKLIKFVAKGNFKISKTENPEIKQIENDKGQKVLANEKTIQLFINAPINNFVQNIIEKPLNIQGIDEVKFSYENEGIEITENIDQTSKVFFKLANDKNENSNITNKIFQLSKISFSKGKWELIFEDKKIWVEIRDDIFINKILQKEIQFGYGDLIQARVQELQKVVNGRLTNETIILEVLEHIKSLEQEVIEL